MKKAIAVVCALVALSGLAEEVRYACSLHVGNSTSTQNVSKGGKSANAGATTKSSKTKTVSRIVKWPVSVSVQGKEAPKSVMLKCYYFGSTDGKPLLLDCQDVNIELDESGNCKTEVSSPEEKIIHTTTTTKHNGNYGRSWWSRRHYNGGGSANKKTSSSGTKVTGCIIQLVVDGKLERAYSSNQAWSRFAKTFPLQDDKILNLR